SAEKAGPAGSVVDHAFDAKDTAVASFSDTETSPAMMSCCTTPLIATNDANEAIMTTVTATGLTFWRRWNPYPRKSSSSRKTHTSTKRTNKEAPQRNQRIPDCIVIYALSSLDRGRRRCSGARLIERRS